MGMERGPQGRHNYHIKHLHPKEYVVLETRRHWFSIIKHAGGLLPLAALALVVGIIMIFVPIENSWLKGSIILIPLLIGLAYIGWHIFDWTNDFFIITNQRVIFIDKTVGVQEQQSEAPMNKVHNVRIEFAGRIAQALDYGNLALDTAGLGILSFDTLPNPRSLREKILEVRRLVNQEALPVREERRLAVLRGKFGGLDDPNDKPMEAPYVTLQETGMDQFNILLPHRPQRQGETVIWHRHWVFLLRAELKLLGVFALVIIIWMLIGWATSRLVTPSDPYALADATSNPNALPDTINHIVSFVAIGVMLLLIPFFWYVYEDWRNDKYSLTHDRVLTVEKKPLGGREVVTETLFGRITDVSYTIKTPLAMMLNYGTVVVKTPGEATAFLFRDVPDPRAVQQEITTRLEAHRAREAAQWDNDIVDWLAVFAKYYTPGLAGSQAPTSPNLAASQAPTSPNLNNPDGVRRPNSDSFFDI
ncbi:MAG: hypothetical protein DLM69_09540 [Candidatus Chloroheliales bacterium]|nr:MAG: hypothetical protein DLM69_09540 [Chloroflexota bacterium]